MSKSLGNHIGITEPPDEIYGKTLRSRTRRSPLVRPRCSARRPRRASAPRDAKHALARALVERFHGAEAAAAAAAASSACSSAPAGGDRGGSSCPERPVHLPALIADAFGGSRSDARRTIAQGGGVELDGEPVSTRSTLPAGELDGRVLQLGKRHFRRLRVA